MEKYTLIYSESFKKSLQANIFEWQNELLLPDEKIRQFVQAIYHSFNHLKQVPEIYENVADRYGFDRSTYRILIGKSFALFYRIIQEEQTILIGNMFKQKQLKLQPEKTITGKAQ